MESEIAEIWYRLDDTFLLPKINMRMGIESPHFIGTIDKWVNKFKFNHWISMWNKFKTFANFSFVQRNLFVSIMSELIKEILDPIKDAGYNVYLLNPGTRLEFHVSIKILLYFHLSNLIQFFRLTDTVTKSRKFSKSSLKTSQKLRKTSMTKSFSRFADKNWKTNGTKP